MTGSISPAAVDPLAGNTCILTVKVTRSRDPIINEGIDTNAVVITIMTLSSSVFLRSAAKEPKMTPITVAIAAAITPSLADVFNPSVMMSMTIRPLCFREGPKRR